MHQRASSRRRVLDVDRDRGREQEPLDLLHRRHEPGALALVERLEDRAGEIVGDGGRARRARPALPWSGGRGARGGPPGRSPPPPGPAASSERSSLLAYPESIAEAPAQLPHLRALGADLPQQARLAERAAAPHVLLVESADALGHGPVEAPHPGHHRSVSFSDYSQSNPRDCNTRRREQAPRRHPGRASRGQPGVARRPHPRAARRAVRDRQGRGHEPAGPRSGRAARARARGRLDARGGARGHARRRRQPRRAPRGQRARAAARSGAGRISTRRPTAGASTAPSACSARSTRSRRSAPAARRAAASRSSRSASRRARASAAASSAAARSAACSTTTRATSLDADGISLAEAFAALGLGDLPHAGWLDPPPSCFVELHIEQGPTLAAAGASARHRDLDRRHGGPRARLLGSPRPRGHRADAAALRCARRRRALRRRRP